MHVCVPAVNGISWSIQPALEFFKDQQVEFEWKHFSVAPSLVLKYWVRKAIKGLDVIKSIENEAYYILVMLYVYMTAKLCGLINLLEFYAF